MYMTWANSVGDRSICAYPVDYDDLGAVWFLKNHHSSLLSQFSSLITHHYITHHLSLKIPQLPKVACLTLVSNFDNSKNFTFLWDPRIDLAQLLLLFFFPPSTPNTQTHWTQGFLFLFFFLFSVFPLLVLSKLYSVICCGVEGVGGVNGRICYDGLVWCFVVCMVMVFFSWVLGLVNGWRGRWWTVLESNLGSVSLCIGGWRKKKKK